MIYSNALARHFSRFDKAQSCWLLGGNDTLKRIINPIYTVCMRVVGVTWSPLKRGRVCERADEAFAQLAALAEGP